MNSNRLWIVPANDLEAVVIRELLSHASENVLVTGQPWGATWAALEPRIVSAIQAFRGAFPEALVYGIELAGPNSFAARDLDHHFYPGDDRRSPLTSLEQVAEILGVPLTREQTLVAVNDREWIPGLLEAGATRDEIHRIRARDRAAQGVTPADEQRAARDLDSTRLISGVWLVPCPDGHSSAHSDLLFDRTGRVGSVLLMSPQEWSYSGPLAHSLADAGFPEKHWAGGAPDSGYFGIAHPSEASRERILQMLGTDPTAVSNLPAASLTSR